ncbi:MAG: hypothetical protein ACC657_16205 [Thiohalomonadales bacterium]
MMRILISVFTITFVIFLIALAYLLGQKSVNVNVAALTPQVTKSVSCVNDEKEIDAKETLSFPLIKHSIAANANIDAESPKDAIDTTVIHAIRQGKWTVEDNRVFMSYISNLDKKERISVLKEMNKAINYQQMHIGSYIPNL